jgi:hypothetical protein
LRTDLRLGTFAILSPACSWKMLFVIRAYLANYRATELYFPQGVARLILYETKNEIRLAISAHKAYLLLESYSLQPQSIKFFFIKPAASKKSALDFFFLFFFSKHQNINSLGPLKVL